MDFHVGQGNHCIKYSDKDYSPGRKYHPYFRKKSLSHCSESVLDTLRYDAMFLSLDTVSELELYNDNGILAEIMNASPYNMQSSLPVLIHIRAKRVVRADPVVLGFDTYDDLVGRVG